jgi:hypothetical protein
VGLNTPAPAGVEGFVSFRRLVALDGDSFAVLYEVDDVEGAKAAMGAALQSGALEMPTAVQLDPPPTVLWFEDYAAG